MRRTLVIAAVLFSLLLMGIVFGQAQNQPPVRLVAQIGEARPRGVIYDPNFDRMAYVDIRGQLVLADATTYLPQAVLYETGLYNAYTFSHDGRWLAVAIETRVEVFDTATGERVIDIKPDGAIIAEGPLYWADDDELIAFNTQVRAPQELRRSENDTVNLPYIWDWQATRRARASILPNRVIAQQFFDFRNGLVFGDHGVFIIGLPKRLEVRQIGSNSYPVIDEISSTRNEPDPMSVWESAFDDMLYIETPGQRNLIQIDTANARILDIPTEQTFSERNSLPEVLTSDVLGIIGDDHTEEIPELLRLWLGAPETGSWGIPHTVELVDILLPMTAQAQQPVVILKDTSFSGLTVSTVYHMVRISYDIALSPDGTQVTLRYSDGDSDALDTYSLVTGNWLHTIHPVLSERGRGNHLLAYDGTGTVLLNDYERYDARTGNLISQNVELNYGYDQFYFPQATGQIVTVNDQGRWVWDFYTKEPINTLTIEPRGQVVEVAADQSRYLSEITIDNEHGYEIYDVASGDRRHIFFDDVPQRQRQAVYPSPSWENYLVVYGDLQGEPYPPTGNAIALYTMGEGQRWLMADDDLPFVGSRDYGWLDDETVYIRGVRSSPEQPERIYGIDYDGSGLPACLIDAFPETYPQWVGYWDSLVWWMRPDDLNRLAVRICAALPTDESGVDAILFPAPTATRLPVSPTPAGIAGVPSCLTSQFPNEAREYAAIWSEIIDGLTPEEIEEQERLLCQSLQGGSISLAERPQRDPNVEVMLININTQIRSVGGYIPQTTPKSHPSAELIAESMRRAGMSVPSGLQFSPDGRYIAGINGRGFIEIYELTQSYDTFAAEATGTAVGFQPTDVKHISLLPTPTRGFDVLGGPRPTLTPTVTATPPAKVAATAAVEQRAVIDEVCPVEQVYTMDNLPPEWAVTGKILLRSSGIPENPLLVLQPEDGSIERDYESLDCSDCERSYDQNWVRRGNIISHPDGSGAFNLEDMIEALAPEIFGLREDGSEAYLDGDPNQLSDVHFIDLSTVQYTYRVSLTDVPFIMTYFQRLNLETGEVTAPVTPSPRMPPHAIVIDYRTPEQISIQNSVDPEWMVVRLPFHTGTGEGSRYYLYHIPTQEIRYLARVDGDPGLSIQWHPLGHAMYFRYPGNRDDRWYRLDTETGQIGLLGDLPGGIWSRDARYRFSTYIPPQEEYDALEEAGEINHFFQVWDSESGLTRRYCVPLYTTFSETALWSPDNRYVLVQGAYTILSEDEDVLPVRVINYLLFDTKTGYITELTSDALDIIYWTQDEEQPQ